MIRSFGKLTRRGGDITVIGNVDFYESCLSALLRDFVCRFVAHITIPRTDEHAKSFGRELTRDLVANPPCSLPSSMPSSCSGFGVPYSARPSSFSDGNRSLSIGCGFDGNSSTSRNFLVITRERTSTSSILRDAWSIFSLTADNASPNLLNSVFTAARRFHTSLERFWIARVRKPICKLLSKAASVV